MPCTVVVGGQFGSEGKGKVTSLLASKVSAPWVVRCGGPNSGHTSLFNGKDTVLRQLPSGLDQPGAKAIIPAGAVVDEKIIIDEIERHAIRKEDVVVDRRAILLKNSDRGWEKENLKHISSTCSGTGCAQYRRLTRSNDVLFASDSKLLSSHARVETVAPIIHEYYDKGGNILIEGSQGFGLSLFHGYEYPYVTSRDTTASGFITEAGLSPKQVDSIILVIRTFPIRTGRNGKLPNEISWDDVQDISGAPQPCYEIASVTKRPRRVGDFDIEAIRFACMYNRPTAIAIMGMDRIDNGNQGKTKSSHLTQKAHKFIKCVEDHTNVPVLIVGTGFKSNEVIWLKQ